MSDNAQARAFDDGSWLGEGPYCVTCGRWVAPFEQSSHQALQLARRLWVYTNYDCNLACRYCLVSSSPLSERRPIPWARFSSAVDEAHRMGIDQLFLTGGEPFLLPELFEMISFACARMQTTVLSNAMLLTPQRLERLAQVSSPRLRIQVSLDDAAPWAHDAYRGEGTWQRTVAGIRALQGAGVAVRVATTITPATKPRLQEIRTFVRDSLGISDADHVVRPLLRRGFSDEGQEVSKASVAPELTLDQDGVYWHPAGTDDDLRVAARAASLQSALREIALTVRTRQVGSSLEPFR